MIAAVTPTERVVGMLIIAMQGIRDHDLDEFQWATDMVEALEAMLATTGDGLRHSCAGNGFDYRCDACVGIANAIAARATVTPAQTERES